MFYPLIFLEELYQRGMKVNIYIIFLTRYFICAKITFRKTYYIFRKACYTMLISQILFEKTRSIDKLVVLKSKFRYRHSKNYGLQ